MCTPNVCELHENTTEPPMDTLIDLDLGCYEFF